MKGYHQTVVGDFFEKLTQRIFGGNLSRNKQGDIYIHKDNLAIEVKSSSEKSHYGFRLDLEQVESYRQSGALTGRRTWYIFYSYSNQRLRHTDGTRKTELSLQSSGEEMCSFLAKHIRWCIVVDLEIIQPWTKVKPISRKSVMGHLGTKTVDLSCREVRECVVNRPEEWLEELGFTSETFTHMTGEVRVNWKVNPEIVKPLFFPLFLITREHHTFSCFRRRPLRIKI
jgi:hypothetical protein